MAAYNERGNDLYESPPAAIETLLRVETLPKIVWEPCCGPGVLVRHMRAAGITVVASDLVDYGDRRCPDSEAGVDFFTVERAPQGVRWIVTNPPYMHADRFIRHALTLVDTVVVLLRLVALEGAKRSDIIDGHCSRVWLGRERLPAMHRDGWEGRKLSNSGAPFGWFVFEREPARPGVIEVRRMSWREQDIRDPADIAELLA